MPDNAPPPDRIYLVFTLPINPQTVIRLMNECANWANLGTRELYILFSSIGGDVASGIAAYNTLRSLPIRIVCHNIGNIDSIANIIFLAGDERIASPHATFMFHGVGFDALPAGRVERPLLTDRLETIDAEHKKMASIINERANFNGTADILNLFAVQATKEADYALGHGIVHKIEHHDIPRGSQVLVFSA